MSPLALLYVKVGSFNLCLSIRKLMSVVKDVDLEAMPTSIFLNDDDDDDDDDDDNSVAVFKNGWINFGLIRM